MSIMQLPYGLISQIMEETGLSRRLVSCVLTSSIKLRRKPDKSSIEKIAQAMNKRGYDITPLDLSVGHGISFSKLSVELRNDFYSKRLNSSNRLNR